MIGIRVFTSVYPYGLLLFIVTALYAIGLLFILHREKWGIVNAVPLLLVYYGLMLYGSNNLEWEYSIQLLVTGFAIILKIAGIRMYPVIYQGVKEKGVLLAIDWYTIVGFMTICSLYPLTTVALWTKLLPGLLITGNLILQRKRIPYMASKWTVFLAFAFLLQPYYTFLINSQLPALFEREWFVLPWVVLVIFLKKVAGSSYKKMVNNVQWAILIIVAVLLIQDGMESSTIQDALIVGILALASILGEMAYQMKSFFFVGVGVLLLHLFLQTRPAVVGIPSCSGIYPNCCRELQ